MNKWFLIIAGVLLLSVLTYHVADNSERFKIMTEGVKNGESFDTIYSKWEKANRPERYSMPDVPASTQDSIQQ